MRKDVKFGLTIGAFLVVTLVVYIIVLSQGGTKSTNTADVKAVAGTGGDQVASPTTPTPLSPAPSPSNTLAATDTHDSASAVAPLPGAIPTTDPSAAQPRRVDWNDVLQRGPVAMDNSAQPDHTITPTPGVDANAIHPTVDNVGSHPLIDSPAALSPAPLHMDVTPETPVVGPAPTDHPGVSALTPPATQPSIVVSGVRTHKVASGETLSIISKAVYGSSKYWDKILAANPNINPKNLKVGATLVIPDLKTVSAVSAASDHGADLPTPSETAGATASSIDPTTTYVIVSGDSLEKIAIKLYGKPQMKETLYQANKGVIGEDEDVLKVGMLLKLPQAPTVTTASR